jgi:hypothetical protein
MESEMADEVKAAIAALALAAAGPVDEEPGRSGMEGSFPIVELRQYTLHEGQRDTLVELFEREFIESQEAVGMKVIGTFTDLDRPDRFVWLRGYRDMESRLAGLTAFYGGPVWQAHRNAANATMIDSDNVLLLRAPSAAAEFHLMPPAGLIVATIYHLKLPPTEALSTFESKVKPQLEQAGAAPIAWFVPETAPNSFPRLPVREGERMLVWFARFDSEADHAAHRRALADAAALLGSMLSREPEVLRLKPTKRSRIQGIASFWRE